MPSKLQPSSPDFIKFVDFLLMAIRRVRENYDKLFLDWKIPIALQKDFPKLQRLCERYQKNDFRHSLDEAQVALEWGEHLFKQNHASKGGTGALPPNFPRTPQEVAAWSFDSERN